MNEPNESPTGRLWKARITKPYAEATNHVVIGEVLQETPTYVRMRCRTFHFKRPTINANIVASETQVRIFPWKSLAYVTEIREAVNWERARATLDRNGHVVLTTGEGGFSIRLKETLDA